MDHNNDLRAFYTTRENARQAACALNDQFKSYLASYRRLDDKTWVVEATGGGITLPQFTKILAAAGLDGKCF